jgi:Tfp pilus assembly protein PilN
VFAGASFLVVALLYAGVWWYLGAAERGLSAEAESLRAQSNSETTNDVRKQIKLINNQIADYVTLAAAVPRWSVLLQKFALVVPVGVQVQSFAVDSGRRQVSISGIAPTRDLVILLHDNIAKDSDHFSNVDYPLENVARPKDISFHYTFQVKEDVLK